MEEVSNRISLKPGGKRVQVDLKFMNTLRLSIYIDLPDINNMQITQLTLDLIVVQCWHASVSLTSLLCSSTWYWLLMALVCTVLHQPTKAKQKIATLKLVCRTSNPKSCVPLKIYHQWACLYYEISCIMTKPYPYQTCNYRSQLLTVFVWKLCRLTVNLFIAPPLFLSSGNNTQYWHW